MQYDGIKFSSYFAFCSLYKSRFAKTKIRTYRWRRNFCQRNVDANLDLDVESTDLLNTIELNAYLGFSETGQSAKIPVKDKLFNLEKRLPFSVSQVVRNDETPDYKAEFKFYFTPVFDY